MQLKWDIKTEESMPTSQKGQETRVLPLVKDEQSSCSACHDYDSSQGIIKQVYEHVGTNSDKKEQVFDLILTLLVVNANGVKIETAVNSEIASRVNWLNLNPPL